MMIAHLLMEQLHAQPLPRVPESRLVMEAPDQINAFAESGRDNGILIHQYLLNAVLALPVIRPGDTVLDLACGPANQLTQMARLNPQSRFIGLDASSGMLDVARETLARESIDNVSLVQGNLACLDMFDTASLDCVLCTMSLHHLPDTLSLQRTMQEIRRVLKPGGGVFLADFGRLKRLPTQRFFASDRAELQSEQFTRDFLDSLRAAFSEDELGTALTHLAIPTRLDRTALAPFLIICRGPARRPIDAETQSRVKAGYQALTPGQQRDFNNMARWYRAGGLPLPCPVD